MNTKQDHRYRSRKWIMALLIEVTATLVMLFMVYKLNAKPVQLVPILSWWATVSGGVLTLYGATSITDKKLNGKRNG